MTTLKNPTLIIHTIVVAIILSSCSSDSNKSYKSSHEALTAYRDYLADIRKESVKSGDELAALCRRWHTRRDSVISAIDRDNAADTQQSMTECFTINDSIRVQLSKFAGSLALSFTDYIAVREALSDVKIREEERATIRRYEQFFTALDGNKIKSGSKSAVLRDYQTLLQRYASHDFRGKADVLNFVKAEDVMFRSFLAHLATLGDASLSDIRSNTETICRAIFDVHADSLSREDAVILMTMRSNRRLLQNADACLADVKRSRIKDDSQSAAYLWMLIQPMLSLDDLSLALMTAPQRTSLSRLAQDLPDAASKLEKNTNNLPFKISELPTMLVKAAILGNR